MVNPGELRRAPRRRPGARELGFATLLPLKDNIHSPRVAWLTLALIAAEVGLWIAGWKPDLSGTAWPLAAAASLFVSSGFWQVLVDAVAIWLFAESLETAIGRPRLAALFVVGGIAAAGGQELVDPATSVPSVGVAGSVAALIGCYAVLLPRARMLCWVLIPFFVTFVEVPALIIAAVWFALQAIGAVGQPPVAGLIAGLALGVIAARPLAHGRPSLARAQAEAVS